MNRDTINFQKEPATTLFRKLLIPTLLGSIAMSAVSTIDGIFVGHGVGADGVAAVNIVVPIYQLIAGLGLMIGSGCSIVSTIHLSYQKQKVARINITQALVISTLFTVAIVVAVLLFPIKTARLLGTSETLQPLVLDYLKWIMPAFAFEIWMLIGLFIIRLAQLLLAPLCFRGSRHVAGHARYRDTYLDGHLCHMPVSPGKAVNTYRQSLSSNLIPSAAR